MAEIKVGKNNNIVVKVDLKKFLKSCLIFLMVVGWVFSGWPRIWQEPPVPPEIQEAEAAEALTNGSFDGGTTGWTLLDTVYDDTVYQGAEPGSIKTEKTGRNKSIAGSSEHNTAISTNASDVITLSLYWKKAYAAVVPSKQIISVQIQAAGGDWSVLTTIWTHITVGEIDWTYATSDVSSYFGTGDYDYRYFMDLKTGNDANAVVQVWIDTTSLDIVASNQAPVVEAVSLTPDPITLTDNTTTTVTCTSTISDSGGGGTIVSATATIYRSGVTESCSADDNNCYPNITPLATSTSGNNFYATFTQDLWFHADPTDAGDYIGEWWECYVIAEDSGTMTDTATGSAELNSLSALIVTLSIDYGTLSAGASTTVSATTTVTTTGNIAIDVKIRGTDLATSSFTIPGGNQEFATSVVNYGDPAATSMPTTTQSYFTLELESLKPVQHDPTVQATATDNIYWGILIPAGQDFGTYFGTTTVAATPD